MSDDRAVRRYGVALEHEYRPTGRTGLTVGVAYHGFEQEERSMVGGTSVAAGAYYEPRAGTTVRLSAARKVGFPSIRQLYAEEGGNPDLDPERAEVLEAGVEHAFGGTAAVGVTLFRNRARGFIERPGRGEPFANHDEYLFQGFELTAEARPVRGLLLRASYSHLDAEDRSPGATRQELQHRPRHRTTALGRYTFDSGLSAAVTLFSVADQVHYSRREPVERARLPDYTVVSARIAQRLLDGRAELFIGADNLLDAAYEDPYGSPQATRTLYGGLTLRW